MDLYFTYITSNHWIAKNKAQEQAHKLALEIAGLIIPKSKVNAFKKDVQLKVDQINQDHKRCNDLRLSIWKPDMTKDTLDITIPGVFHLSLRKSKTNSQQLEAIS